MGDAVKGEKKGYFFKTFVGKELSRMRIYKCSLLGYYFSLCHDASFY